MREEATVDYWLVSSGTKEDPHIDDDWWARERRWFKRYGDVWKSSRRPSIVPGDRLVTYAVGSQWTFGKGRVFSLYEVTSEPIHLIVLCWLVGRSSPGGAANPSGVGVADARRGRWR